MKRIGYLLLLVAAAVGAFVAGRKSRDAGPLDHREAKGPVVATFAGHELRTDEVEARLRAEPDAFRPRLASPDAKRSFVEQMAREELVARLAEAKGYQHDPEFVRRYAQELGQVYLEKEFEEPERNRAPTDAELQAYLEAHRGELSRPERVRIALIAYMPGDGDRAKKRALAAAALAEAKARAKDYYAFGNIARTRSDDPRSRIMNGEVPFSSREDLARDHGVELADAAFAMTEPGAIRSTVVETLKGFYVVKLLGREPAYAPRFEEVRDSLRARLVAERRNTHLKQFMDDLWKKADVKIDLEALKAVRAEGGSTARR